MWQKTDLLWVVTQVPAEAPGVLGCCSQHWHEAQASQATEKTLAGLGSAQQVGCFWTNCPRRYFGVSVY